MFYGQEYGKLFFHPMLLPEIFIIQNHWDTASNTWISPETQTDIDDR